jgi:hypothetical protein
MSVFVDDAAELVVAANVEVGDPVRIGDRFGDRAQRCGLTHRLVGTVFVVVKFELVQAVP